jgi:hypothetical protein
VLILAHATTLRTSKSLSFMHFSPLLSTVKAIKALFINKTAVHRTSCLLDNVVRIEIKKTCGLLIFLSSHFALQNVRIGRIELPSHPWQGCVLPLNHIRVTNSKNITYLWSQVEFVRQQIRLVTPARYFAIAKYSCAQHKSTKPAAGQVFVLLCSHQDSNLE